MQSRVLALLTLVLLVACGSDSPTTVTSLPNVSGTYTGYNIWLVQFKRTYDGYSGAFNCNGSVTIVQSRAGQLSGFAVISAPCPPLSFDLAGSVGSDGSVTFTTGGPRPSVGQCPAALATTYAGLVSEKVLSARSSTNLFCPGPGEGQHHFDYVLTARLNN
jgi:hypothetical protein